MFDVALMGVIAQTEKIEKVRVFQRFVRQLRMWRRQTGVKVGDGPALPFVQAMADTDFQRGARPALRRLPFQNLAADLPVQPNQFGIGRQGRALAGGDDALLDASQPVGIVVREAVWLRAHTPFSTYHPTDRVL